MKENKMIVEENIYVAGVYEMATREGTPLYNGSALECNDALSRHLYNLKRGYYMDTNKRILQLAYDREDLVFKVIHKSAFADEVRNMTMQQKEGLQKALSVIEQFNIELNKATVCNKQRKVTKHSSSPNKLTTYKRRQANTGVNNPNNKYDSELIANILYLKEKGLKPKKIVELLLEHDIDIKSSYISQIGVKKWIYLESKKPTWYNESEVM
ncbi:hypothetical protein JW813_07595 [Clostridium botulinum]|uniref:hypothetical protein n=1 Tax=Clostridium botulinum TaxID=1491 RepID=UPI0022474854|nr:hypothetical protein [Clostridium botulinum]UZP04862.1 hypothetical protein JW813_07595 [Clostridium botulinum]UZP08273.1 hypothetical protein JYA71_07865 [Clostridium botulinum]UZP11601.1 hypothetical protein JYA74_07590 [Clostridium botulinum]